MELPLAYHFIVVHDRLCAQVLHRYVKNRMTEAKNE